MSRSLGLRPLILLTAALALAPSSHLLAQDSDVTRNPSSTSSDERAESAYREGRRALDAGELAQAAQHMREALSLNPALLPASHDYARILRAAGRPERAQAVLETALREHPGDEITARLAAELAEANGEPAAAITALARAVERVETPDRETLVHLADLQRRHGQSRQAAETYAQLIDQAPDDPRGLVGRAAALDDARQRREAFTAWQDITEHGEISGDVRDYAESRMRSLRNTLIPGGG